MEEYIFYTTEGVTYSPDGQHLENCQMLGCAFGTSRTHALTALLRDNPWIEESGFKAEKIITRKLA